MSIVRFVLRDVENTVEFEGDDVVASGADNGFFDVMLGDEAIAGISKADVLYYEFIDDEDL